MLPGITFTAKTVLDVTVYPENEPLPESMWAASPTVGSERTDVGEFYRNEPLQRGKFPRPGPPISPSQIRRDITMQVLYPTLTSYMDGKERLISSI